MVLATVLVSAARRPEGVKSGFCFSMVVRVPEGEVGSPMNAACCEGRGTEERWYGVDWWTGERDCFLIARWAEGECRVLLRRGKGGRLCLW